MHPNTRRNRKRPPMPPTMAGVAGGFPPNSHFAVRVVKDGEVDADLPPPNFFPDLNYPPPNYFLLPLPPYVALPPYVGNPHLAQQIPPPIPPYPHRGGGLLGDRPSTALQSQASQSSSPSASQQLLLTAGPEVPIDDEEVIVSPNQQISSPVDDFFRTVPSPTDSNNYPHQSLSPRRVDVVSPTARARHSTDDLMGLLEELCHAEMMAICGGDGSGGATREEFGSGVYRTSSPFPFDGIDMDMDEDSGIAEAFASCHQQDGSSYLDEDLLNMVCATPTGTNTEMNGSGSSRSVSVDTSAPSYHQHQQLTPSAATMLSQGGGSGSGGSGGERRSELDAASVGTAEHLDDEDGEEEDNSGPHPIYYPSSGIDGDPGDCARRPTMPTVLASGEDFKDLILAHNRTSKPLTFLAHRVGPTVFLEGRPTAGEAGKVEEVRKEAMRSKLLYYSKMLTAAPTTKTHADTTTSAPSATATNMAHPAPSPPSSVRQSKPPQSKPSPASSSSRSSPKDAREEGLATAVGVVGDSRTKENQYGTHNSRTDFKRAFKWKVQDMNVLIGVDTPIYRDPASGERVIMHLHDTGSDPNASTGTSANRKKKQQQKQQKQQQQQQSEGGRKAPPTKGNSKGRGGQKRSASGEDVATNFAIEALEDDDEVDAAATSTRKGRVLGSSALASPTTRTMPLRMSPGTSPPTKVEVASDSEDHFEEDDGSQEENENDAATTSLHPHDDESDVVLPHLGQDEALDMWIDAVMTNVRNVAVCLHRDGVVQGYQVVPINKLPTHSSPAFSPVTVQASATGILKWLQDSTECGTSFLIIKDSNSSELRLFDLSDMRPGAPVPMIDAYDSHPDARRRSCWRDSSVVERSLFVDPNLDVVERTKSKPKSQKRLHEGPNSSASMDLIVPPPPPSLNDIDDSPPPIQHHHSSMHLSTTGSTSAPHAFNQFGFPFAMMCFRMAQCLPNSDAECLRLWLRTITLLPPNSEESFLPLAIAHVHAMEHYHSSSPLPDAERVALTHCRQALEALHQLRLSILELVLLSKPHLRDQLAARDSESFTAKLIDEFADEDPEIGSMVSETKRLAIRIVKCMCAMAMQQLRGEGSKEYISAAEEAVETPVERQLRYATDVAVMIGRAMENVLFAQEALALRAHEAPSGLIMANPDLTASRSPTTMSEVDFAARMGPRGGTSINTAMIPTPPLFSSRFDVMACFEVVSTLSADIASRFLQTTLDLRVAQASLPSCTSPPTAPTPGPVATVSTVPAIPERVKATLIETFVAKLNRDIKVTLAVMNTAWRVRSSGLTGVESSTPEHINFIERLTPFYEDPIKTFDAASALYHVALAYNNILFSGRGAAVIALKRKIAGLNALVAEMYSRNLVGASSSSIAPTDANSSSQQQNKIPPPMTKSPLSTYEREEKAMQFYDRAAKSFIQCRDYPNAARNFINAAKMSLRTTPLSSGGVAALSKAAFPRSEEAVAIAMRPVHAAIDFLELIDRFGSHLNSSSARTDTVSAVVAEAQQMLFNVYTFAFRARSSFFINPVTGELNPASPPYTSLPMTAAVESFLHDRYLNPASRLPKKFAKIASTAKGAPPEETVRRASEVKVLQMMLSLHWQCGSPTAPITQSPPPGSKPTTLTNFLKRRLNSTRHAKHRLRQLWGYMVYPEGKLVPFELFREACDIIVKKMQCEIFLITIAGSGMDVGGEVDEASLLEAIERSITAVSELRPWIVVAENNQLDKQQACIAATAAAAAPPPSVSSKPTGGKKGKKAVKEVEVEYVHLQEVGRALALIPSLLSTTLVSLLRLMKQSGINPNAVSQAQRDAEQQNVRSIITKCLALTTQTEAGVTAPDVIECLDMATHIFKGRKRKQGGGPSS